MKHRPSIWAQLRQALHRRPELSGHEHETANTITQFLTQLQPDTLLTGLGGTGVAATFNGQQAGEHWLFRCELDALPITETNAFAHRSEHTGVSHKCGHDGHMAIICGLASRLAEDRSFAGRRTVLFQPAEETGAGALAVVADPRFKAMAVDRCYALHNLPGIPLGEVQIKAGTFNCASVGLAITLHGESAHAAHPEQGRSPAPAMTELLRQFLSINTSLPNDEINMISVVYSRLGNRGFGTIPATAEIGLTLRTEHNTSMQKLKQTTLNLAQDCAQQHGLGLETAWHDEFLASVNDETCTKQVAEAAESMGHTVTWLDQPMRWSKDFGAISAAAKGAMFVLGAGLEIPQIHDAAYDFPDALIEPAMGIFKQIAYQTG
jgi:amidohydrolase